MTLFHDHYLNIGRYLTYISTEPVLIQHAAYREDLTLHLTRGAADGPGAVDGLIQAKAGDSIGLSNNLVCQSVQRVQDCL